MLEWLRKEGVRATPLGAEYSYDNPVLICIDAVLSINRRYNGFVVPRISRFRYRFPHITTLTHLKELVSQRGYEGFAGVWDYEHADRVRILDQLIAWFLGEKKRQREPDDLVVMRRWADGFRLDREREPLIAGLGPATLQYLRMLLGVSTAKPDRYIRRAVAGALGHPVSDEEAVQVVTEAARAPEVGAEPAALDYAIWKHLSSKGRGSGG
jgi:hypothetical protein